MTGVGVEECGGGQVEQGLSRRHPLRARYSACVQEHEGFQLHCKIALCYGIPGTTIQRKDDAE